MFYKFIIIATSLIFSNLTLANSGEEDDVVHVECNSHPVKFEIMMESVKILSNKTGRETELDCFGQCSIDEWACVSVDGIPYLWFRGTNAIRNTVGSIDGHEFIGHWAIQLNEIDWNIRLEHKHAMDISRYFEILDKTQDEQIVYNLSRLDFEDTLNRSKYKKIAHHEYSYISKVYESATFFH